MLFRDPMSFHLFTLSLPCQLHPKVAVILLQRVAGTNLHALCFLFQIWDGGVECCQRQERDALRQIMRHLNSSF